MPLVEMEEIGINSHTISLRAVSTENVILKAAIKKAVLAVASADCDEWFACTGYCQ